MMEMLFIKIRMIRMIKMIKMNKKDQKPIFSYFDLESLFLIEDTVTIMISPPH